MTKRISILVLALGMSMGLWAGAPASPLGQSQDSKMQSHDKDKMSADKMDKMEDKGKMDDKK